MGVLVWGDLVAGGGVARGVTNLGGEGTGTGSDVSGGGTTLGGIIAALGGDGCVMGAMAAILLILEVWRVRALVALIGCPSC